MELMLIGGTLAQAVSKACGGAVSLQGAGATVPAFGTEPGPDVPTCAGLGDEQGLQVMTWGQDGAAPAFLGRALGEEAVRCDCQWKPLREGFSSAFASHPQGARVSSLKTGQNHLIAHCINSGGVQTVIWAYRLR